jgi:hypothetical protein
MNTGRNVKAMGEARQVPLRALRLDQQNPRLTANMQGEPQEELAVHLELGFDPLTVAESIASHGYFGSEPLIVIAGPAEHGEQTWTVVEGNRRLTALLGLVYPAIRTQFAGALRWDELASREAVSADDLIPVVVLPDRSAATPIIGFRHISGILQWQPYAQARYIARLVDEEGMGFADVAKMIGIDRTKVGNLYRDQAIAKQAADLGIPTGPLEEAFSLLTVAMSTTKLRDHLGAPLGSKTEHDQEPVPLGKAGELRELITWLYGDGEVEPVIGESRDIGKLGNVVANPVGLTALRKGETLEAATQKVKDAEAHPRTRLVNRLKAGRSALLAAVQDIADFADDEEILDLVEEVREAADAMLAALDRD